MIYTEYSTEMYTIMYRGTLLPYERYIFDYFKQYLS